MNKNSYILWIILLLGTLYHAIFFGLNDVLKVADSFAYLQMAYFLGDFSVEGLGNGWFGFLYSLPIAFLDLFIGNDFLSSKIINLILFNISAFLLFKIARKLLSETYSYVVVILFFLSPTLLHFNIHTLSENIYIPLFLGLFLVTWNFIEKLQKNEVILYRDVTYIACLIGLMYLTRAEAFIYIMSIGIISITLLIQKKLSFINFFKYGTLFFLVFFVFISPYLIHLYSLTGEWGLTNKGASNLRQAELRGQEKMDDIGFEKAVAELTEDKHHLIAGFAGGMPYDKPQIEGSLGSFILKDPVSFGKRVLKNQYKLFSENFPEIILGKSPKLFFSDDLRFKNNIIFLLLSILPLGIILFGLLRLYKTHRNFLFLSGSFFIPAAIFFTLFFTLNRYFLIFFPLILIVFTYGVASIKNTYTRIFFVCNYIGVLILSTLVYYNIESPKDEYYALKKEAGEWLRQHIAGGEVGERFSSSFTKLDESQIRTQTVVHDSENIPHTLSDKKNISTPHTTHNLRIMERFPIVTYYSQSKTRYITPYTDNIEDIKEYGKYNKLDILVVDTMDFKTYRPDLIEYLETTPSGFIKMKEFKNEKDQKVILYLLEKL